MNPAPVTIFPRQESELIACCARKDLTPRALQRISEILHNEKIDWAFALRKANWHGILPLLARHLTAAFPNAVPSPVLAELKRMFQLNARRNLNLAAELLKLLRAFSSRGIPVVPFKGPIAALSLYGDLALRQFIDLDLLIRRADILSARKVLIEYALVPQFDITEREELIYFDFRSEDAFSSPDKDLMVDLHCALTPRHFSASLDWDRFARRLQPMPLGDTQVLTFSREDLLLLLCIHGAKDMWERLILVADIAEILRSGEPLDWSFIREEAAAVGGTHMLHMGLLLARDLLEADLPEEVLPAVNADLSAHSLAAQAATLLLRESDDPPSFFERQSFAFRSIAEPVRAFLYVAGNVLTPTPLEWRLVRFPESFSFLYRLLRPLRLTGKHLRTLVRPDPMALSRFRPTPDEVITRMLELAEVTAKDVVFDLGSGDGKVLIAAAQRYGATGCGFEINPALVAQARANAKRAGVQRSVKFRNASVLDADLSRATVVTMYLPWAAALKLRPKFLRELRPGARIVSHEVGLADWLPDRVEHVASPSGANTTLYLWRIGAAASRTSVEGCI